MSLEELEKAFECAKNIIRNREDGKAFVPIAQRLEREIMNHRDQGSDYERYMKSAS